MDALTLAAPKAAAASAFLGANVARGAPPAPAQCLRAVASEVQLRRLFVAIDRIPTDAKTKGGEPLLDFEFFLRLVLDFYISRARAVLRCLERCFAELCAGGGDVSFGAFALCLDEHRVVYRGVAGDAAYADFGSADEALNVAGRGRASLGARQRAKKENHGRRLQVWKALRLEAAAADKGGARASSARSVRSSAAKRASAASLAKKLESAKNEELEAMALSLDAARLARACFVAHVVPADPPDNEVNDQAALDTVLSALDVVVHDEGDAATALM